MNRHNGLWFGTIRNAELRNESAYIVTASFERRIFSRVPWYPLILVLILPFLSIFPFFLLSSSETQQVVLCRGCHSLGAGLAGRPLRLDSSVSSLRRNTNLWTRDRRFGTGTIFSLVLAPCASLIPSLRDVFSAPLLIEKQALLQKYFRVRKPILSITNAADLPVSVSKWSVINDYHNATKGTSLYATKTVFSSASD